MFYVPSKAEVEDVEDVKGANDRYGRQEGRGKYMEKAGNMPRGWKP